MKPVPAMATAAPAAILFLVILLVAGILSPDAASQACSYGENTKQGETVYTTGPATGPATGTGSTVVLAELTGMNEADATVWYGGAQGPDNACALYAWGQCTWWSCMREFKLGHRVGPTWGNGMDWAASAAAAGWRTSTDDPVVGSVLSFPPGSYGADPTYGHVGVVEQVDRTAGTVTISEKSAGVPVSARTLPLDSKGAYTYANPPDVEPGTGTGTGSPAIPSTGSARIPVTATKQDDGTMRVNVDKNTRPAQCSATGSPFTYTSVATGAGSEGTLPPLDGDVPDGLHASPDDAKRIARAMLPKMIPEASSDEEYSCLAVLWDHESGWQWDAYNAASGATGIPQSLPGGKMAAFGADWRDNAATQIAWGLDYIRGRYGTPCQAWAFWQHPSIYVPGASGNWY